MSIAFCGNTALRILRAVRTGEMGPRSMSNRVVLEDPSPREGSRWTRRRVMAELPECLRGPLAGGILDVAVTRHAARLKVAETRSVVWGQQTARSSFVPLGGGLAISSPELLFFEMREELDALRLALLGMELCGGYSLPVEGRGQRPTYFVPEVCSAAGLRHMAEGISSVARVGVAREAALMVRDGCWSPMEPVLVAFAERGIDDLGYEAGATVLNRRENARDPGLASRMSRVPDIMFEGTPVGINYDGAGHYDIDRVVRAALDAAAHAGDGHCWEALDRVRSEARMRYADDRRRDRDLWVDGLTVLTATKEDLYQEGALDLLMGQVIFAIERTTGRDMRTQREALADPELSRRRYQLLRPVLP